MRLKSVKVICVFISVCFVLLTGCGGGEPEATKEPVYTAPPTPVPTATAAPTATPVPTPTPEPTATAAPTPTPLPESPGLIDGKAPAGYSPTTGKAFTGLYQPVCIMIENTSAARPQSGLSKADVVYESYVEGGTTRFFAVFSDEVPEVLGPVRSARKSFINLYLEWGGGLLIHYGGSQAKNGSNIYNYLSDKQYFKRIDGIYDDYRFWRSSERSSPHNAYINGKKAQGDYKDFEPKQRPFLFDTYGLNADYSAAEDCESFTVKYITSNTVKYVYDKDSKVYLRYVNGSKHTDKETGKQITVKNIIVQHGGLHDYQDKAGHVDMKLLNQKGTAEYFIEGKHITGTWRKGDCYSRTRYYDDKGNEIVLKSGNTWIQFVPDNTNTTVTLGK